MGYTVIELRIGIGYLLFEEGILMNGIEKQWHRLRIKRLYEVWGTDSLN